LTNFIFMEKNQFNLLPIREALTILELTRNILDDSKEQLKNMKEIKDKPYLLDDVLINRSIKLYTKQNEDSDIFLEQCRRWRKEQLTEVQLYQVQEIENIIHEFTNINNEILTIINTCKDYTIDKILKKDDMELVFDFLTEKASLFKEK